MKKTYTSDEIVDLLNQYEDTFTGYSVERVKKYSKSFEQWLKDKEQQEFPVEDKLKFYQEIWVTDVINHQREWVKAKFTGFNKVNKPIAVYKGHELIWDEYSLTDPNY